MHECIKSSSIYSLFTICFLFFFILDEEVDRVNPLCTTSKFSWKVYIGTVLFKPWIFRQWLCGCGGYERVCTLCNLFGNHFLEQHSSHIYIKGSLEYSGLSRNYSNATGSGSVIERFQNQLLNKRSINHRYVYKPIKHEYIITQFDTKTEVFTMTKNVALAMRFQEIWRFLFSTCTYSIWIEFPCGDQTMIG